MILNFIILFYNSLVFDAEGSSRLKSEVLPSSEIFIEIVRFPQFRFLMTIQQTWKILDRRRQVYLEINAEKTKYMFISCHESLKKILM